MKKMIRVLHVTTVFQAAGIESFIMNMYRHIDRNKVQFDFMVMRTENEFYDDEIKELGGKKYTIQENGKNTLIRVINESRALYQFLKENPYDIVHVHYTTPLRALYLKAIRKAGVKTRIYHSHSAEVSGKNFAKRLVYLYLKRRITDWATDYFACSNAAAEWMFSKSVMNSGKVKVIYNGIDINRFKLNEDTRQEIREQHALQNSFVMIHTGRFFEQKNHTFILKVFEEVQKRCHKAKLMLLGTGDLFEEIKQKVDNENLSEDVVSLGVQSNVECFLCAADCYIMPSLYEGLPVAAVEAQCSGLPCVFSTNITREVALTTHTSFLDLNQPIEEWANAVLESRNIPRVDCSGDIREQGYDVLGVANRLQNFYEMAFER